VTTDLAGFRVFPVWESFRRAPRSTGVALIIVTSLVVVGLNGAFPGVERALEARTDALAAGQYWRLFTYVFPHDGGWIHVCVNMALLGLYGWQLERIVGTVRFLVVYLATGAVAMALLFSFRQIDDSTGITSGASLAVFAVVAAIGVAYTAAGPDHRKDAVRAAATVAVLLVLSGVISMARRRVGANGSAAPTGFDGIVYGVVNHSLGVSAGLLLGASFIDRERIHARWRAVAIVATVVITATALAVGTVHAPADSRPTALRP
jgi:membrane associated rhomboid family serine protease